MDLKVGVNEYRSNDIRSYPSKIAYTHFANTLVSLLSNYSVQQLASARLKYYANDAQKYASSTEQLKAENEIISFIHGGHNILNSIRKIEELGHAEFGEIPAYKMRHIKSIAYLQGDVQTGKSAQMIPEIIKLTSQIGEHKMFILSAHSEETLNNFRQTAAKLIADGVVTKDQIAVYSRSDLVNGKMDGNHKSNAVIFADEASLLLDTEIRQLESNFITTNKNNKIIFVGDNSQMPTIVGPNAKGVSMAVDVGFRSTPTKRKFATKTPLLTNLMDFYNENIRSLEEMILPPFYFEKQDDGLHGTQYFTGINNIVEAGIQRIKDGVSSDEMTITFLTERSFDNYKKDNPANAQFLEEHLGHVTVLSNDPENKSPKFDSIQGGRRDEVFVAFDGTEGVFKSDSDINDGRIDSLAKMAMYTLIGRGKKYVAIIGDAGNFDKKKPIAFESDSLSTDDMKKSESIEYLKTIMNGNSAVSFTDDNTSDDSDVTETEDEDTTDDTENESSTETKGEDTSSGESVTPKKKVRRRKGAFQMTPIQKKAVDTIETLDRSRSAYVADGDKYVNSNDPNDTWDRVTRKIHPVKTLMSKLEELRAKNEGEGSVRIKNVAEEIGTGSDDIFRDVLRYNYDIPVLEDGTVDYASLWNTYKDKTYEVDGMTYQLFGTLTEGEIPQAFKDYVSELHKFKEDLYSRGEVPYSGEIRLRNDATGVMGTPDLITVDKEGKFRIYDLKTKTSSTFKGMNDPSSYMIEDKDGNSLTTLQSHQLQISTYLWMLANEPTIGYENIADHNPINLLVFSLDYDTNNIEGISNVNDVQLINFDFVPFGLGDSDITKLSKRNTGNGANELKGSITRGGLEISVGFNYADKSSGDLTTVVRLEKKGSGVEVVYFENGDPTTEIKLSSSKFAKKFKMSYPVNIEGEVEESSEYIKDNDDPALPKEAAERFEKNNSLWITPVSIHFTEDFIKKSEIDFSNKNTLESFKAMKSIIMDRMSGRFVKKDNVTVYKDDGSYEIMHNVITLEVSDIVELESVVVDILSGFQFSKDFKLEMSKAISLTSALELFGTLGSVSLPRKYNPKTGLFEKIAGETLLTDEVEIRNSLIEATKSSDELVRKVARYNVALLDLHNTPASKFDNKEDVVDSTPSKAILVKSNAEVPVSQLKDSLKIKGMSITMDGNPVIRSNSGKYYMALNVKSAAGRSKILVFTEKLANGFNNKSPHYKKVLSELKKEYQHHKTKKGYSKMSSTMLNSFLMTNKDAILSGVLPLPDINGKSFINAMGMHKGFLTYKSKYHKDILLAEKEHKENVDALYEAVIKEMGSPSSMGQFRLPYKKGMSIDVFYTNTETFNQPARFIKIPKFTEPFNQRNSSSNAGEVVKKKTKKAKTKAEIASMSAQERIDYIKSLRKSVNNGDSIYEPVAEKRAIEIVSKILGDKYSKEWAGFTQKENVDGVKVFGYMMNGKIKYVSKNGKVNRPTIRHEIFHVVDDYFLGDDSKAKIYKIVRDNVKGYEAASDNEVKEFLADWYGAFGHLYKDLENIDEAYLGKYKELLNKIKNKYDFFQGELAVLFNEIENGKYANAAEKLIDVETQVRITRLSRDDTSTEDENDFKTKSDVSFEKNMKNKVTTIFGAEEIAAAMLTHFKSDFNFNSQLNGGTRNLIELIDAFGGEGAYGTSIKETMPTNIATATFENTDTGTYESMSEATPDDFMLMSTEEQRKYTLYHIYNDTAVSKFFLKLMFPKYNPRKNTMGLNKSATFSDKEYVDSAEYSNQYIDWFLGSFLIFEKTDGDSIPTMEYIPEKEVSNILRQASSRANIIMKESQNNNMNYFSALKTALKEMMPNLSESNIDTKEIDEDGNIIYKPNHFAIEKKVNSIIVRLFEDNIFIPTGPLVKSLGNDSELTSDVKDVFVALMTQVKSSRITQHVRASINKRDEIKITEVKLSTKKCTKKHTCR